MSTGINPIVPGAGFVGPFAIGADGTAGQVLSTDGGRGLTWVSVSADHGGLTGLSDDDHTIYALLAGRSGGQTLIGDTASGGNLTLQSTAHATKGSITSDSVLRLPDGTATAPALSFTGKTDTGWYRESGRGINLATNGAVKVDFTSEAFSLASTVTFGWAGSVNPQTNPQDTILRRNAAANVALGGVAAAAPVNQKLSAQDGSGSNIIGANLTLAPGVSTGNATPASVIIQSTVAGASGAAAQTPVDTLKITNGQLLAATASGPQYSVVGGTGYGMRVHTDRVDLWIGGSVAAVFDSSGLSMAALGLSWSGGSVLQGGADGAHRLVQRNSTNAQAYSVASTYTSFTNKEEVELGWTSSVAHLWTIKGSGGGTARDLVLGRDATEMLRFGSGVLTIADAVNIATNTGTGTKIGTATTQKIALWNATPVVQPTAVTDADGTLASATSQLNALLAKMRTIGAIAT